EKIARPRLRKKDAKDLTTTRSEDVDALLRTLEIQLRAIRECGRDSDDHDRLARIFVDDARGQGEIGAMLRRRGWPPKTWHWSASAPSDEERSRIDQAIADAASRFCALLLQEKHDPELWLRAGLRSLGFSKVEIEALVSYQKKR